MFSETKRKKYNPPTLNRLSQKEAEEKVKRAIDAGDRDAAELLTAIRQMKQTVGIVDLPVLSLFVAHREH